MIRARHKAFKLEAVIPSTLLKNGYIVSVEASRAVYPGGFVAIDGTKITAVGAHSATPSAAGFDEVIDLSGC
ncbi:MAG TPA: hypothetical protein VFK30_16270, partial [Anaerolineae bacterium]|nr:hypothetical protein [Anaerolineae bacterium]